MPADAGIQNASISAEHAKHIKYESESEQEPDRISTGTRGKRGRKRSHFHAAPRRVRGDPSDQEPFLR